jgi:hypothetical protein
MNQESGSRTLAFLLRLPLPFADENEASGAQRRERSLAFFLD